jgi:pimeloyl-ACP methyl ester carboxylesterase
MGTVNFRKVDVDGIKIFYREAGPKDAPTILLLHGFPTAGHMFRDLIPQLADRFRLVTPDLPGFRQSDMPTRRSISSTRVTSPLRPMLQRSRQRSATSSRTESRT